MSTLSLFTHVPFMLQGALRIMRQLRSERLELDHEAPPRTEWYDRPSGWMPVAARGPCTFAKGDRLTVVRIRLTARASRTARPSPTP